MKKFTGTISKATEQKLSVAGYIVRCGSDNHIHLLDKTTFRRGERALCGATASKVDWQHEREICSACAEEVLVYTDGKWGLISIIPRPA